MPIVCCTVTSTDELNRLHQDPTVKAIINIETLDTKPTTFRVWFERKKTTAEKAEREARRRAKKMASYGGTVLP